MSLLPNLRPGGRHGVASTETRDPIGYLVAGLSRLAQTDILDRIGLRKQAEQAVFTVTRSGFGTVTKANRTFQRSGSRGQPGVRPPAA
ncbi:MAG: acyl-CoA dehydrogenase, partial [Acidimicrobiales bacterium]